MQKLEIKRFEGGLGVLLPNDALRYLNVGEGSSIFLLELPDGGFALTAKDPEIEAQLERAEDIMKRYRNTLRVLAE